MTKNLLLAAASILILAACDKIELSDTAPIIELKIAEGNCILLYQHQPRKTIYGRN